MKNMIKAVSSISVILLCLVFSNCDSLNKEEPETSVDIADLPHSIKGAYAIPLDSLQLTMNEVEAMVDIALKEGELLKLEDKLNRSQKAAQATLDQLKTNPSLDKTNRRQVDMISGKQILSGAGRRPSDAKSKAMRAECLSQYELWHDLIKSKQVENRETQILFLWFISELRREFKGSYVTSQMNDMIKHTKLDIQGVVKGDLTQDSATFDLDFSKKYIVFFTTATDVTYYSYVNELGITRKPSREPEPKRVLLYYDRLLEDRQVSEKDIYTKLRNELKRGKTKLENDLAAISRLAPVLADLENKNVTLGSNTSKENTLKKNISTLEAKKRRLESSKDRVLLEIKRLKDELK